MLEHGPVLGGNLWLKIRFILLIREGWSLEKGYDLVEGV
jgi:hypothetical protein